MVSVQGFGRKRQTMTANILDMPIGVVLAVIGVLQPHIQAIAVGIGAVNRETQKDVILRIHAERGHILN